MNLGALFAALTTSCACRSRLPTTETTVHAPRHPPAHVVREGPADRRPHGHHPGDRQDHRDRHLQRNRRRRDEGDGGGAEAADGDEQGVERQVPELDEQQTDS